MRARVLIVDDDPAMCAMLRAHLVKRRYEVATSEVAAEAFELLRSGDFDVVVTDLQMRGMNGLELCERIAANRPDIPVIVITAFGSLERGHRGHPGRRLRLRDQAVRHRAARASRSSARSSTAACARRSSACARWPAVPGARRAPGRERGHAARARPDRARGRLGRRRCSSPARAAPARSWSRARSTTRSRAATARSSPSTARRCRRRCSRASCSATRAARSPTPGRRAPACSSRPTAARCSSTRSASCRSACRPSSCARCRSGGCGRWAATARSPSTCASSPRPTAIWRARSPSARFREDLLLPHQRRSTSSCRRCARAAATSCCWPSTSCERCAPAAGKPHPRHLAGGGRAAGRATRGPGNVRELQNCIERAVALAAVRRHRGRGPAGEDPHLPALARGGRRRGSLRAGVDGGARAPLHPARAGGGRRQQDPGRRASSASTARTLYRKLERYGPRRRLALRSDRGVAMCCTVANYDNRGG